MTLPKFIITINGVFRLGLVNQHKHIYKYDDSFHDDYNVSEELTIEYYD